MPACGMNFIFSCSTQISSEHSKIKFISTRGHVISSIYVHIVQKRTKNQCGKVIKIHDFCPRDIKYSHHAAATRMNLWPLNANVFFEEPHQLNKFA